MAHRPSILSELSPEEILEYWSLLSAEQRAAFIERHGAFDEKLEGLPAARRGSAEAGGTLFDRFAGVFHAFGCLRRHMEESLADERYDDAEMRLLGAKYDSLPELLRKTLGRTDGDAVLRYITFLTAKQLRDSLEDGYPTFFSQRQPLVRKLDRLIADGIEGRGEVFPGEDGEARSFLDWFEAGVSRGSGPPLMRTITPEFLDELIDFAPSRRRPRQGVRRTATRRRRGCVQYAGAEWLRVPRRRSGHGQDLCRPRRDEPAALPRPPCTYRRDRSAREHPAQVGEGAAQLCP